MSELSSASAVRPRTVVLIGLGWLLIATSLSAAGVIRSLRPPAPQFVLGGLTAVLLAGGWFVARFRVWLSVIDARWLVALNLTRFVGVYFLYLYARGQLPYAFAVPGGLGDIVVASLATVLLLAGPPRGTWRRRAYAGWNALGLADILFVVATAARLGLGDPESMAALLRLPPSLLPTFLVPLIIVSHVVLGVRLASARVQRCRVLR